MQDSHQVVISDILLVKISIYLEEISNQSDKPAVILFDQF